MASAIKLSRFGKIAALTGLGGGSLYIFRDELKPYLKSLQKSKGLETLKDDHKGEKDKHIENLPEKVPYILVGGGTASHSAMKAIRGHDPKAKVLIIASENRTPYMRPALSKELWYTDKELRKSLNFKWWSGRERSIFYEIDEFFIPVENLVQRETGGVSIIKDTRLIRLDPDNKIAYLKNGQSLKYEKCLLATGGRPKTLPELDAAPDSLKERVLYFRTADDFLRLDEISGRAKRLVVIGGGFLGSELTCALANRSSDESVPEGQVIYQIFPETGNLGKILPQYLSEWVTEKVKKEGAKVIPKVEVKSVSMSDDKTIEINLTNGETLQADYIICAVGLEPDVELAKSSGLEVDEKTGGYLVNSELEARTDVWVAGDASCFYDIKLGRRRVEHHDHAINSGRLAGQNMIGAGKPYTHQSMFWSDLGIDLSFEAVGIIDSNLETISVFAKHEEQPKMSESSGESESIANPVSEKIEDSTQEKGTQERRRLGDGDKYGRGVVFYLRDGIIVGILLWNLFSRLTIARRLLDEQKKYDDFNEVAKLFNLYLDD